MLSQREMFKVAFLQICAENGFTLEETHQAVKEATAVIREGSFNKEGGIRGSIAKWLAERGGKISDRIIEFGGDTLLFGGKAGLTAAVLAPIAVGSAVGYGLGRGGGNIDPEDVESEKQRELIDAYQSAASRARSKQQLSASRRMKPRSVRSLI